MTQNIRSAVFAIIIGICLLWDKRSLAQNITCLPDACNRPDFCNSDKQIANPDDCETYYKCVNSEWTLWQCSPGTSFHHIDCECVRTIDVDCHPQCPSTLPRTTLPPGPCDNIPEPCEDGVKYPDKSSCEHYYTCNNGMLGNRQACKLGSGSCITNGFPCVFDVYVSDCIHPDDSFVCDYRCMTTVVMTTLPGEDTTTVVDGMTTADVSKEKTSVSMTSSVATTTTPGDERLSGGAIAGIVIALVITVAVIIVVVMKSFKNNKVDVDDVNQTNSRNTSIRSNQSEYQRDEELKTVVPESPGHSNISPQGQTSFDDYNQQRILSFDSRNINESIN